MQELSAATIATTTRRLGRWQIRGQHLITPLLGSALRFTVTASPTLTLTTANHANPLAPRQRWAVRVDRGEWQRFPAGAPHRCALNPAGSLVEVMTAGNSDLDEVWFGDQDFALTGIFVADGAQVRPAKPRPLVTVFGDSIAAGCWVAGHHASIDYRPEANYLARGADQAGVDLDRVAYSAAGLTVPGAGQVPVAKDWLFALNATTPWTNPTSDLVIVALGANDRRAPKAAVQAAYQDYLTRLTATGFAQRLALLTPFDQTISPIVREVAPQFNAVAVDTTDWCSSFTDGLHPDLAGSATAGDAFARTLKKLLK